METRYRTIVADPPWSMKTPGRYKGRGERPRILPYSTMTIDEIKALPIGDLQSPARTSGCGLRINFYPSALML